MLRKKILIQIFNYTCILFKSKRLLKRITETLYKQSPWDKAKKGKKKQTHRKNEHSISIAKERRVELETEARFPSTPNHRTQSLNEYHHLPDFGAAHQKVLEKESQRESSRLKSLKELGGKHRNRTSSIEVIIEEKEYLMEIERSNSSREKSLTINSEINERIPEIAIDLTDAKREYKMVARTDEIEVVNVVQQPPEEEESKAEIFDELLEALEGQESVFLDNENFKELQKGFMSLKPGINNITIPINKYDVGSIIAYSLSTN